MEGGHSQQDHYSKRDLVEGASSRNANNMTNGNTIAFLYFNARSIIPKYDELCAIVAANSPDIVCIVETWLDSDITDSEIDLPGYEVHRLDRNRHGGGVLVYVRNIFITVLYPSPVNLELLTLSISTSVNKVYISLLYRPPNSPSDILENVFLYLQSLNINQFCNYILLGDFNVNLYNQNHFYYSKLVNIFSSFGLTQVVSEPTHVCPNGNRSVIDLVALSAPSLLLSLLLKGIEDVGMRLLYKLDHQLFSRSTKGASEVTVRKGEFAEDVVLVAATREAAEAIGRAMWMSQRHYS